MKGQKDDKGKLPIGRVLQQFPRALEALAMCSQYGNSKYNLDTDWQNFRRVEDAVNRYDNAQHRHKVSKDKGELIDPESKLRHEFHELWNHMAKIECKLEVEENEKNN